MNDATDEEAINTGGIWKLNGREEEKKEKRPKFKNKIEYSKSAKETEKEIPPTGELGRVRAVYRSLEHADGNR